jgi:hypothetical protein
MECKKIVFAMFCLGFLFLSACKDNVVGTLTDEDHNNAESISGAKFEGNYNYTAYDSLGSIVAVGTLSFEMKDSTNITGVWEIKKVGDPQNIGPQVGKGELVGGLSDGTLWIELNPEFRDNNVFLQGKLEKNKYNGKWFYSSFIGLTNWGTFEAEMQ